MTQRKRWIVGLSLAVLAWLVLSPLAAQQAQPQAVFLENEHHFGPVDRGARLEHTFKVRNDGVAPLEILSVKPT